jgi:hypothetical protein
MNYKEIESWINFLSISQPAFNNLPVCPFAKQSLLKNKILICNSLDNIDIENTLKTYEVIIVFFNPDTISPEDLYKLSLDVSNDSVVALDDHPFYTEKVQDVILNNGSYALLLIQCRDKLNHARSILNKQGYYNNWDPAYLTEVLEQ